MTWSTRISIPKEVNGANNVCNGNFALSFLGFGEVKHIRYPPILISLISRIRDKLLSFIC